MRPAKIHRGSWRQRTDNRGVLLRHAAASCAALALTGGGAPAQTVSVGIWHGGSAPAGTRSVDPTGNYPDAARGGWYEVFNFKDANNDGLMRIDQGASGDQYIFTDDRLRGSGNTCNSCSNCEPYGVWPVGMAGPTILWVPGKVAPTDPSDEGWYYITGSTDYIPCLALPEGQQEVHTGNFAIYRTRDFLHFYFHKWAFDDSKRCTYATNDCSPATGCRGWYIQLGTALGTDGNYHPVRFARLNSPHLYMSEGDSNIYLAFGAVREQVLQTTATTWINTLYAEPLTTAPTVPPSCDPMVSAIPMYVYKSGTYMSCYVVRMNKDDFTSSDESKNFTVTTTGHEPSWYGYTNNNTDGGTPYYDGGQFNGNGSSGGGNDSCESNPNQPHTSCPDEPRIPCTINTGYFNDPSHLLLRQCVDFVGFQNMATSPQQFWSSHPAMLQSPFMFHDPATGGHDWLLYGWASTSCDGQTLGSCDGHSPPTNWDPDRGVHIAGAKLADHFWRFDNSTSNTAHPFAYGRNDTPYMRIPQPIPTMDNGIVRDIGTWMPNCFAVAEGQSVLYHEYKPTSTSDPLKIYFLLYSRNAWNSPAYDIVYRRTVPGGSFESLIQTVEGSQTVDDWAAYHGPTHPVTTGIALTKYEDRFIGARRWTGQNGDPSTWNVHTDRRSMAYGRGYGEGDVFFLRDKKGRYIVDPRGNKLPYMIYHAKFDGNEVSNGARTLFFRNLEFSVLTEGSQTVVYLLEQFEGQTQYGDHDTWRFRLPKVLLGCITDVDGNHAIEPADISMFVTWWGNGSSDADFNRDGTLTPSDVAGFVSQWYSDLSAGGC